MIYLIWISALSFVAAAMMIGTRVVAIRTGRYVQLEQPTLFSVIQKKIDFVAVLFVLICREGAKFVSLNVLMFLKKSASYLKVASIHFEKKFARVIDMVHGKGAASKKGAVSFFLREIKDHNDKMKVQKQG